MNELRNKRSNVTNLCKNVSTPFKATTKNSDMTIETKQAM